jgi:hypothetical protein
LGGGINQHIVKPLHNQPPYVEEKSYTLYLKNCDTVFEPGQFIAINVGSTMKSCNECETYNYTRAVKEVQCEALPPELIIIEVLLDL